MPRDPRWYQIAVLTGLLVYGIVGLDFDVTPGRAALLIGTALFTQWACERLSRSRSAPSPIHSFEPKSALISALSLCLLLRTGSELVAVVVAVITIASKFTLRVRGKHVFNPTNFGLAVLLLAHLGLGTPGWVSPGQWGQVAFFGFLMACLGTVVVTRARRADVTFAFLGSHVAILFGRAAWLGQPWSNPLHQLQNGALLLFAFFMISDPRTTPDRRAGRVLFAALVAAGAFFVQYGLYRPNGLLWSLAVCSLAVPLIDRLLPAGRYEWLDRGHTTHTSPQGDTHHASLEPAFARSAP